MAAAPTKSAPKKWVASLPAKEKDAWLVTAALDPEANVGATVLQRYQKAHATASPTRGAKAERRTAGELYAAAGYEDA
ncbi:MAG: hypothetical protein R3A52_26805 [Polyangiales bacterium]